MIFEGEEGKLLPSETRDPGGGRGRDSRPLHHDSPPGRMNEALGAPLTARGARHGGGGGSPGGRNRADRGRSDPHRGPESPSAALAATARGDRSGPHAASSSNSAGGR